jgi:hypothetical protein
MSAAKQIYFVTGLPRSRTAWFANYLTWADSFCYHDALVGVDGIEAMLDLANQTPATKVGFSDPALLFFWPKLMALCPGAKWVVILRDPRAVKASSEAAFGAALKDDQLQRAEQAQLNLLREVPALTAEFHELTGPALTTIAHYLGIDMPVHRTKQLMRLQVQIHPTLLKRDIARLTANPPTWLAREAA